MTSPLPGSIGWIDLTVADAPRIRDFYHQVAGWSVSHVPMGDYDDYNLLDAEGTPVAGICHAQGVNAGLPSHWLMYITVTDIEASVERARELGGEILRDITGMGALGRYAVIRDPADAVFALFEPEELSA
ncbi:MAG: VOC family protein [Acidobacteria bacterium]|jgi:predicted enzyme related to lactoylglutathione lyase|nr:VOC family protein [Acidobacteriota bacterium]